jgi:hypothetical protein
MPALICRHLLHTDPFVIGLADAESEFQEFYAQIPDSVRLRVHAAAVELMHPQQGKRYAPNEAFICLLHPILHTVCHCLANEAIAHPSNRNCGSIAL